MRKRPPHQGDRTEKAAGLNPRPAHKSLERLFIQTTMENTTPDSPFQAGNCVALAGISPACIARNGIRHVDADQAAALAGSKDQDGRWESLDH